MRAFLKRAFFGIFEKYYDPTEIPQVSIYSKAPRKKSATRNYSCFVLDGPTDVVDAAPFNYFTCVTSKGDKRPLRASIVCRFAERAHNFCHMSAKSSGDESSVAAAVLSEPPFGRHHPGDATVVIVFRISRVTNKGRAGCFSRNGARQVPRRFV